MARRARQHRIRIGTARPEAVKATPTQYLAGPQSKPRIVAARRAGGHPAAGHGGK